MVTDALTSYKLVQLGVDASSGDLWWSKYKTTDSEGDLELRTVRVSKSDIPAWTLSSLFNMLPDFLEYDNQIYHWTYTGDGAIYVLRYVSEDGDALIESEETTPFQCLFHMLVWLCQSGFGLNDRYKYFH